MVALVAHLHLQEMHEYLDAGIGHSPIPGRYPDKITIQRQVRVMLVQVQDLQLTLNCLRQLGPVSLPKDKSLFTPKAAGSI